MLSKFARIMWLFSVILLVIYFTLAASPGHEDVITWNFTYGGTTGISTPYALINDSSGAIFVVGTANVSNDVSWIIKRYYRNGSEDTSQWNKTFAGGSGTDIAYDIDIDSLSNIYVVGEYNSSGGSQDWWIKRFNSNGTENITRSWNQTFNAAGNGYDVAFAVAVDSQNSVYVAGVANNITNSSSFSDWWIKKFYLNGSEDTSQWNKTFSGNMTGSNVIIEGDSGNDQARDIVIDSNDNVYVVGYFDTLVTGDSSMDAHIKRFNRSGTENLTNWNKSIDVDNSIADKILAAALDSQNSLYVTGTLMPGNVISLFVKKYYNNGSEDTSQWNKTFSVAIGSDGRAIALDNQDNVYVGGDYLSETDPKTFSWIKRFNRSGTENLTHWNKTFGGHADISTLDTVYGLVVDSNNNLSVVAVLDNGDLATSQWWIKKFTEDTVIPLVSLIQPSTTIYNVCSINQSFNASVKDQIAGVQKVLFQFENGTKPFNLTATNRSGIWGVNLNFSRVAESNSLRITVFANDSANNVNASEIVAIDNDCTAPSVTLSKDTSIDTSLTISIATSNDAQTCTSSQGTVSGIGASQSILATGLTAATSYTFNVDCTDEAGNRGSASITASTDEASSSGDGGGSSGSSGSSSSAAAASSTGESSTTSGTSSVAESADEDSSTESESAGLAGQAGSTGEVSEHYLIEVVLKNVINFFKTILSKIFSWF